MSLQAKLAEFITAVGADVKTLFSRSVPAGGTSGQVLAKTSGTDYAVAWVAPSEGGGAPASGFEQHFLLMGG